MSAYFYDGGIIESIQGVVRGPWRRDLRPSSKGKRVRFTGSGGKRTVVDGPFAETKELVSGYWIWQVKSIDEAVEWVRRCPDPMPGEESEIEIRPIYELEDLGKQFTPELRAQEEQLRAVRDQCGHT